MRSLLRVLLLVATTMVDASKRVKDRKRLLILCCANMSGSDKVKLLVIGKSEKPSAASKDSDVTNLKKLEFSSSDNFCQKQTVITDFLKDEGSYTRNSI